MMDPGIDDEPDPDALIDEDQRAFTTRTQSEPSDDETEGHSREGYNTGGRAVRTWALGPADDGGIPVQVYTDTIITKWHTANGPQEKAYDDMVRLDCGFTIAEEHIYNGKRSFGYRAFNTEEDVFEEITSRTLDKRSLYEKIPRNKSARVYFDLEWEHNGNDPKANSRTETEKRSGVFDGVPYLASRFHEEVLCNRYRSVSATCLGCVFPRN